MTNDFDNDPIFFAQVTPPNRGAIAVFHIYLSNNMILGDFSRMAFPGNGLNRLPRIAIGEIKYTKIHTDEGVLIDEVLLAQPSANLLVLMCHGGMQICLNTSNYLKNKGLTQIEDIFSSSLPIDSARIDWLFDPLLAGCLTETQAAVVLEGRAAAHAPWNIFTLANHLLATRHICLVGLPNAGKSSLLNRLSGFNRAFVHKEAGTTLDVVCELVELAGYAALVEDLPGFPCESAGIMGEAWNRAAARLSLAEAVVFVVDAARGWDTETSAAAKAVAGILSRCGERKSILLVLNKSDLPSRIVGRPWDVFFSVADVVSLSSLEGGDAAAKLAEAFYRIME